jgi:hypothetical protein
MPSIIQEKLVRCESIKQKNERETAGGGEESGGKSISSPF